MPNLSKLLKVVQSHQMLQNLVKVVKTCKMLSRLLKLSKCCRIVVKSKMLRIKDFFEVLRMKGEI